MPPSSINGTGSSLPGAEKAANDQFSAKPVGNPIEPCPLRNTGGERIVTVFGVGQSEAQAKRANDKFNKLSDADKKRFQDILHNAQSDEERIYIWKAFGACHSIDESSAFAGKIRGKNPTWLNDNCRLTASSTGTGIQQQWSHSCNATTAQAVRGEMDPIYALKEHEENPNWGPVDDSDATKRNPKLASEQKKMLESEYTGLDFATHKGIAVNRAANLDPRLSYGRWASDLLNNPAEQTGVTYVTKPDPSTADALKAIDTGVDKGVPVPIVIGDGSDQLKYAHYVLVTGRAYGPPKTYTIHDPSSGKTFLRTEEALKNGKIDIAGWNRLGAVEDPQLQAATPATKAIC